MPRDSQLLPAMSRALLRAARAGCIYIRSEGRAADEDKKEPTDGEDQAGAGSLADRSFTSRRWTTLSKHMETPEVEFLAKRRAGLPSLYGATGAVDGSSATPAPMRKTKFKKVDKDTGSISIYEVWVPEGHRLENEITGDIQTIAEQSQAPVKAEMPAPGTLVEGVGIVNSEGVVVADAASSAVVSANKRRPPPPKRKGKGIGKGRKKKVMFAPGEGADAATVHEATPGTEGALRQGQDASGASVDQSGQDDDEDDGEEGDESDEGDESMVDAKTPETPQPPSGAESADQPQIDTPADQAKDVDMTDAAPEPPAVSPPAAVPSLGDTSQTGTDASAVASVKPSSPAEKTEDTFQGEATALDVQPPATAEAVVPKVESQAQESAPVDVTGTSEETEKPSEVKAEPQLNEGSDGLSASSEPPAINPPEPAKEAEAEQLGRTEQSTAETFAPSGEQESTQAQAPDDSKPKEEPVVNEPSVPATELFPEESAEPSVSEPTAAGEAVSSVGDEPAFAPEAKPQDTSATDPRTGQQDVPASESAPEEKKEGESASAPVPESA